LIINPEKPLCKGAMYSPGFFPKGYLCKRYNGGYYVIQALAKRFQFDPMATSWNKMSKKAQKAFLFGLKEPLEVTFESRSKKIGNYTRTIDFRGFYGWIGDWDVGGTYSSSEICPACNGTRLRPKYLKVALGSYNIHELNEMPFSQLLSVLTALSLPDIHTNIAQYSLDTILHRLEFLNQVGLGYINASRVIMTLSAGEAQRIRLAGLLGSNLTSLTVLADEPTRGLHPSEIDGLLKAINSLRENNTIIIVEHDPQVIKEADYVIDLGPGPGELGGDIVAQGSVSEISKSKTITGMWLGKKRRFKRPKKHETPRKPQGWLKLIGASQNNLKGNPVEIPLGTLVSICGVSGSGKSTLMIDTLGRILAPRKQTTSVAYEPIEPGKYSSIEGAPSRTMVIDQSKQEVSTPLTYLNLRKPLMSLYAESDDAKAAELDEKSLFQQCPSCRGRGRIRIDMGFLPDVYSRCDICQGTGLTAEAWVVRLHGYTLPELYDLTLDEIYDLFKYEEKISRPLKSAKEVGLGYLVLKQARIHLSGGECQRLKIAKELSRKKSKTSTLYILDEPTVGLHLQDVSQLLKILHRLVDEGNTVVVIEHHPHVLAASDWIIEIGPAGGPEGGYIIAHGTPVQVAKGNTPTAQYLNSVLEGHA
jgi:excinuclease ABC subunit A